MTKPLVAVFTKPSRAGLVKTRLIGHLSAEQAADLHAAFLGDLTEELVAERFDLAFAWALADAEELPEGAHRGVRERGADLGERLWNGLSELGAGRPAVAAVGSDAPRLRRERVDEAFAALASGADVALGPAEDGGYYLIALRSVALVPELFRGVAWSTAEVFAQTVAICGRLGLAVAILPRERDVDTPADLASLAEELGAEPRACPRTRSLLARWGRLAPVTA